MDLKWSVVVVVDMFSRHGNVGWENRFGTGFSSIEVFIFGGL